VSVAAARLPAPARRQALIETAVRVFSSGGYRGSTTADIARAAGVSEPILYRHFESKRDLYLAAVDHVWQEVRRKWEAAIAAEPDPRRWLAVCADSYLTIGRDKAVLAELWVQALAEANADPELRRHLRRHMKDVHGFLTGVIRRSQEAGGVLPERDPVAEAWIFLSGGVLGPIGRRIGLLDDDDVARIRAARTEWMTGDSLA
jgi:AcrR family transcriptional regulator